MNLIDCRKRLLTPQTLKAMKLTFILLTGVFLQVGARGNAQNNVTYSGKNVKLETIFSAVEEQTGFAFFYNDRDLKKANPVTVDLKNIPLQEALTIILKNQPLTFSINGKTIVIKEKITLPNEDGGSEQLPPPPIDITGKVTDADGNPLPGATVKIKGTSKGTTTNNDGVFVLKGVDEDATLEISFVGYETYTVGVNSKSTIVASLKVKPESLNEVVINKGYYTEQQKYSVGNVSKVTSKEIEKQPVNNPLLALQGRVPGLVVTQATGFAGSGVTVRIQGQNSIASGGDPLYVIDGVPYMSQLPSTLNGILGGSGGMLAGNGSGNPLSFINPNDIESIDILKDADATAIYGSRAANGAILITTKKGKVGRTKVDINVQTGWGKVGHKLDLLNTQEYLQIRREGKKNDNASIRFNDYDLNGLWDTTRYTDWQKELIGGTARYTDLQTTISGGSPNIQYLIGAGYHKETTVFPGDLSDTKGSLHFSINNVSPNQKFRAQLSGSYQADDNRLITENLVISAMTLEPNAPNLYNSDGTLNWAPEAFGTTTWKNGTNPLAYLLKKYNNKTSNLISNAVISYKLFSGLEVKSSLGFTKFQSNETNIEPLTSIAPEDRPYASRTALYGNNTINSWIFEPQLVYTKNIFKGKFEFLLGGTFTRTNADGSQLLGYGYTSDLVMEDIKSAPSLIALSSVASVYKYNAFFGRLNYNWQNKYIINLVARRDGSSRFGPENQFHNFGSIGSAWIFSNEKFIQKIISFLSFGKLRASYGTTGNDQIGDYRFINQYNSSDGQPYQDVIGLRPNNLYNPYLQWEETNKMQIGLDLGFLKDRIILSSNYFRNRSSNQLLSYSLPIITGFPGIERNFPATVQNSGLELTLSTSNIQKANFKWSSSINLTIPKNKLIDFPNLSTSSYASQLIIGQPITLFKAYDFLKVNPTTGLFEFVAKDGSITSYPNFATDRTVFINTAPTLFGGFQNNIQFKKFELDISFQFVKQKRQNYFFGNAPGEKRNQPSSVLGRWQKPGDISSFQRISANYPNSIYDPLSRAGNSDAGWSDASYIRLKNVSISWELPETLMRKAHLQSLRLYLNAQNLLTITKFYGLDPESGAYAALPPLRVLSFGLRVTL